MIILKDVGKYNPLASIFAKIEEVSNLRDMTNTQIVYTQRQLIKAGIITESPSELQTVLEMLFKLKQEYYGES